MATSSVTLMILPRMLRAGGEGGEPEAGTRPPGSLPRGGEGGCYLSVSLLG